MKISQNLPQFPGRTVLLLVVGREEARLLLAQDDNLTELEHPRTGHPRYTDREGRFETRIRGGTMIRSGSVYERSQMEHQITNDFYRSLREKIRSLIIKYQPTSLYLFAPEANRKHLRALLQTRSPKIELRTYIGNYLKAHPFDLLAEIQARNKRRQEKRKLIPPAAQKLLQRKSA